MIEIEVDSPQVEADVYVNFKVSFYVLKIQVIQIHIVTAFTLY